MIVIEQSGLDALNLNLKYMLVNQGEPEIRKARPVLVVLVSRAD